MFQHRPVESIAWEEHELTLERLVGLARFRYTAFNCVAEVSYLVVAPEAMVYEVTVTNPALDFEGRGTVDAQGMLTER